MWVLFARAPLPDARVWAGRRALALLEAVVWPLGLAALILGVPFPSGMLGVSAVALCAVTVLRRAYLALFQNPRYRFTTWRWGRGLVLVLAIGCALKLAAWI
jgi:hypothetical protein